MRIVVKDIARYKVGMFYLIEDTRYKNVPVMDMLWLLPVTIKNMDMPHISKVITATSRTMLYGEESWYE